MGITTTQLFDPSHWIEKATATAAGCAAAAALWALWPCVKHLDMGQGQRQGAFAAGAVLALASAGMQLALCGGSQYCSV
jgi:hypothetical protein